MWGFVFPGQGSQSIGMGKFLFDNFKFVQNTFEEASDAIGVDLKKLCFTGPEEQLALTENTQPALLTCSTAYHQVFSELGLSASVMAGHSLGEYSALVAAKTLEFTEAVKLVKSRGQFMQQAVPVGQGCMIAVMGAKDQEVEKICKWAEKESGFSPLTPANFNSPGQVVISGHQFAGAFLQKNFDAKELGIESRVRLIALNVSAPFHCKLMQPAQDKMALLLNATPFQDAVVPIVQNRDGLAHQQAAELRKNLIEQITAPVLWTQSVTKMRELDVKFVLEVGAGKVLTGLVKKIDSEAFKTFNISTLEELKNFEQELKNLR